MRLLVVEDEKKLCDMIAKSLHQAGYEVDTCNDGEEALEMICAEMYDLIVLDLNLPGMDGMDILRELRKENEETKVLILSARSQIADKVEGLDAGANDYLAKPFAMGELVARVKAMIRRNREYQQTVLNLANVTLDLESNELSAKSGSLILSVKEAKFLALFLEKEDISYSVEEIAGQVFQGEVSAEEISLYMAYLNNKLVQIHGNLQLMMEDGKISAEKKEG